MDVSYHVPHLFRCIPEVCLTLFFDITDSIRLPLYIIRERSARDDGRGSTTTENPYTLPADICVFVFMCLSSRRGMLSNVDQLLGICGLYVFGKALNCFVRACFVPEHIWHIVGSYMFSIEMGWKCFGVTSRLASSLPKGNSRPSVFMSV